MNNLFANFIDVVLESGSVLESDSSTYFEDSDSDLNPLDSDSDSNPRTRLYSRCSGIGLSTVWLELINHLYFICYRYSMYRYMLFNFWDSYFTNTSWVLLRLWMTTFWHSVWSRCLDSDSDSDKVDSTTSLANFHSKMSELCRPKCKYGYKCK